MLLLSKKERKYIPVEKKGEEINNNNNTIIIFFSSFFLEHCLISRRRTGVSKSLSMLHESQKIIDIREDETNFVPHFDFGTRCIFHYLYNSFE